MNRDLELLDILNILSFYVSCKSYDENLSQTKASDLLEKAVEDIHKHLEEQDKKLDVILNKLEEICDEKDTRIS